MFTYSKVLNQVKNLTLVDQLRLLEDLKKMIQLQEEVGEDQENQVYVRHRFQPKSKGRILELEGLGEEIWQGIDAQEYVNHERNSWNG